MKALVTGGTGFIGSHLVEELVRQGYSVTCLVRDTSNLRWIENYPLTLIKGDCINGATLRSVFDDFDYVFHLAGITKTANKREFYCINVEGTENLLQVVNAHKGKLKRLVYLSSLAAAGPAQDGLPASCDAVAAPVSEYGKSKLEGEKTVQRYKDEMPVTIIRPPAVYGPRDRDFYLIFKMIKKGLFPYWGKAYYSLIYVEDLVKGIVRAVNSDKTTNKTYYLSDPLVYSNDELAATIAQELGCSYMRVKLPKAVMPLVAMLSERVAKKGIINTDKVKELCYPYWLCSGEEARKDFGFESKVTLKDGIKWTANWYRLHKWL